MKNLLEQVIEFRNLLETVNFDISENSKIKISNLYQKYISYNKELKDKKVNIELIVCKCLIEKL